MCWGLTLGTHIATSASRRSGTLPLPAASTPAMAAGSNEGALFPPLRKGGEGGVASFAAVPSQFVPLPHEPVSAITFKRISFAISAA